MIHHRLICSRPLYEELKKNTKLKYKMTMNDAMVDVVCKYLGVENIWGEHFELRLPKENSTGTGLGRNSDVAKKKNSDAHKGPNNPRWKGGTSRQPYCWKFLGVRERVRNFFGRKCLGCGKPESSNLNKKGKMIRLTVHHVTFDKMVCCNDSPHILAPLCFKCRGIADNDLDGTKINQRLMKIIVEDYGGKCYTP